LHQIEDKFYWLRSVVKSTMLLKKICLAKIKEIVSIAEKCKQNK
jgi:hypothetical protein